jgi:hypothetical protein
MLQKLLDKEYLNAYRFQYKVCDLNIEISRNYAFLCFISVLLRRALVCNFLVALPSFKTLSTFVMVIVFVHDHFCVLLISPFVTTATV